MTKKELEEQVKALRTKLDEAHKQLDEVGANSETKGTLDEVAVGGYFDEKTRQWMLVSVDYNKKTGEARVTSQKEVGADIAMFSYKMNQVVSEKIHLKNLRK